MAPGYRGDRMYRFYVYRRSLSVVEHALAYSDRTHTTASRKAVEDKGVRLVGRVGGFDRHIPSVVIIAINMQNLLALHTQDAAREAGRSATNSGFYSVAPVDLGHTQREYTQSTLLSIRTTDRRMDRTGSQPVDEQHRRASSRPHGLASPVCYLCAGLHYNVPVPSTMTSYFGEISSMAGGDETGLAGRNRQRGRRGRLSGVSSMKFEEELLTPDPARTLFCFVFSLQVSVSR